MSFINFYVLIANVFRHINKKIIEDFTYFFLICDKKATGVDNISPKLLHYAKPVIAKPISDLVNLSLSSATFPDSLKIARVAPIHKKNSVLEKGNYRPVRGP
jgi:hypothetical protein